MRRPKTTAGFTLIEILITVSIIGVLASIATPLYIKYTYKARTVEAATNLSAIRTAQVAYKTENDRYLNVRVEPAVAGAPTGVRKTWPALAGLANAARSGTGTFNNIGYNPGGSVFYHYGCATRGEAVVCEAASDLDGNGRAGLYQLAFRLEENNIAPANLPLSGGGSPPVEWGIVANRRTGEF